MPTLALPDVELHYEVEGAGPAVLLLHGLGTSSDEWAPQREALGARFRVIALDGRGSGRTRDLRHPHGPFTVAQLASDARALLDHLGAASAHVVGWSLGGMVALQLGVDAPERVRSLVIINSGPDWRPKSPLQRIALRLRGLVTALVGPGLLARPLARHLFPRSDQAALRAAYVARMRRQDRRAYAALLGAIVGWSVADRMEALRMPLLALASDEDYTSIADHEAWVRRVPSGRLEVVAGARHALPLAEPERVTGLLLAHLDRVGGT